MLRPSPSVTDGRLARPYAGANERASEPLAASPWPCPRQGEMNGGCLASPSYLGNVWLPPGVWLPPYSTRVFTPYPTRVFRFLELMSVFRAPEATRP